MRGREDISLKNPKTQSVNGAWEPAGAQARVFSGHESFACRYGWMPKLYEAVQADEKLFADDERAILALGLGKNMVKAIRFWGQVFGLLVVGRGIARNTDFARRLLDTDTGIDPYLEDLGSLWRLHWLVTVRAGLGAWVTTFLELHDTQISRNRLIDVVRKRAVLVRGSVTERTATSHVDIFLRTYDWARLDSALPGEDASGCPFQELHLIETSEVNGEVQVSVMRGQKTQLDIGAFAFVLNDYWHGTALGSKSLSVRSLLLDPRSPGVVFRLDEASLLANLDQLCEMTNLHTRRDGVGGVDLVAKGNLHEQLEELAWPAN